MKRFSTWAVFVVLAAAAPLGCAELLGLDEDFPEVSTTGGASVAQSTSGAGVTSGAGGSSGGECSQVNGCNADDPGFDLGLAGCPGNNCKINVFDYAFDHPCAIMPASFTLSFDTTATTCSIRGGTVQEDAGIIDETGNPIELQRDDAGNIASETMVAGYACVPFFCEGQPAMKGAIFPR